MPRPDLALLPVAYRLIPVLAVGRDIYLDTRLILRKLETLFPERKPLGATNAQDKFVQGLLERYMVEGPVFGIAAGLVPTELALDPTFNKDRQGFLGRTWSKEELDGGKGKCLSYIRSLFHFFEETVFQDGREWVLAGKKPSLADIEGECSIVDHFVFSQTSPCIVHVGGTTWAVKTVGTEQHTIGVPFSALLGSCSTCRHPIMVLADKD